MANVKTSRDEWIKAAGKALADGGPDAVKVEPLAASLGVSKGGFYWHFKNRQALIDELLDSWERSGTDAVITRIQTEEGEPRDKIRLLFSLAPLASSQFSMELALRDWSRRDRGVAKRIKKVDGRRLEFLRSLFGEFCRDEEEADARSMLAYSLMVGSYFVNGGHEGRSRREAVDLAVDWLLR